MLKKRYIDYPDRNVYAIFYATTKTIFYNLRFNGATPIILFVR